tara:strand:- start:122 stop:583 length:462 start_codon:yes stop_codon:yes gene_type:complete
MGCGKNYVGKRLAKELDCDFIDGDSFVPAQMADKVANFKPLSQKDIDDYVYDHLVPGILKSWKEGVDIVIAQALYRKEHRDELDFLFRDHIIFIYIKCPLFLNLKRLYSREKGLRWALYGLWNKLFFQTEGLKRVIHNTKPEFDFNRDLISRD